MLKNLFKCIEDLNGTHKIFEESMVREIWFTPYGNVVGGEIVDASKVRCIYKQGYEVIGVLRYTYNHFTSVECTTVKTIVPYETLIEVDGERFLVVDVNVRHRIPTPSLRFICQD